MMDGARGLPLIQTLWIGGELSVLEQLSLASFLKNGHGVHLYTYDGVTGAPAGTEIRDGREILWYGSDFQIQARRQLRGFFERVSLQAAT